MINTLYAADALNSTAGFAFSVLIGFFFGVALERAGLASSRKIAAIFYFRDMTVLKVMLTAITTAAIGLAYLFRLGWLDPASIYFPETVYGAQIVGGLLLGIGMVTGGWCPGTATAGLGSGRIDALLFLAGVAGGSVLFNETFEWVKPLYEYRTAGIVSAPEIFGVSGPAFVVGLSVVAVILFWISEAVEQARQLRVHQAPDYIDYIATKKAPEHLAAGVPGRTLLQTGYYRTSIIFLTLFSAALIGAAAGLLFVEPVELPELKAQWRMFAGQSAEQRLMEHIEKGRDHIAPEDLARRIMNEEPGLLVVDIRPPDEYRQFHIRGAVNVPPPDLFDYLEPYKDRGMIVLYSNGMNHSGQAAAALRRQGYDNVYILTDGLEGFKERCLKPVSLRSYPVSQEQAQRIRECREYFLGGAAAISNPASSDISASN